MIRALVFDFDGLIVDTETPDYTAWRETFAAHGAELSLSEWAECIGREYGYIDYHAVLEGKLGRKLSREEVKAGRKRRLNELLAAEPLRPGVREWLSDARRLGLGAAVASSAPRRWVEPRLEALGVRPLFAAVRCAEDAPRAKPAPDLFLAAAQALGVRPAECVVFEDSPNGIAAARAAGMYCLAVPNEVTKLLDLSGADLVVPSLEGLRLEEFVARIEPRLPDRR